MRQTVLDFTAASDRAALGMSRSVDHADRTWSQWSGAALGLLIAFIAEHPEPFLIEQFRAYAAAKGLPEPPDGRAFGAVTKRAQAKGLIRKDGFGAAASSNCSPKVRWVSVHAHEQAA